MHNTSMGWQGVRAHLDQGVDVTQLPRVTDQPASTRAQAWKEEAAGEGRMVSGAGDEG
jgi:hypothetical protein